MTSPKNPLEFRLFLLAALGLPALIGCGNGVGAEADPCKTTTPITGGFVECADGAINRPTVETCENRVVDRACDQNLAGTEYCKTDADCTDAPNGYCALMYGDVDYCDCVYTCASDADCGVGQVCACAELTPFGWSQCVDAPECTVDADCGPGGECGLSTYESGCTERIELTCRSDADDECHGDADCVGDRTCASSESDVGWTCEPENTCTLGRPMYVDGDARLAPLATSVDWASPLSPADLQQIPVPARPALAARWAEIGRGEHASVASFARFSLHLLSLGAPPELLLATQQAAADEVRHAQGAFAIASALAGRSIGPGPMDLADVSLNASPEQILHDLILEGCVGETVAVVEAIGALARERVPAIAAFRQAVVRDESEHAALAWRCLAWILEKRPALAPVARAAFDEGINNARPQDRDAIERVITPCADALLA